MNLTPEPVKLTNLENPQAEPNPAREVLPVVSTADPLWVLKEAIDRADVGIVERAMAVRKELMAEAAKREFDAALSAFQGECPVIKRNKFGARQAYKYAPMDDIIIQVRGLLQQHGFNFSVTSEITEGWVKATCKITHRAGHSELSDFRVPIDSRNTMMNDPQKYAGSLTFAKRYAFCNAFGIMTGDEDNDGGAKPKPPGPAVANADTRSRMLEALKDLGEARLYEFAIDKGWVLPNCALNSWDLAHVPNTKGEMKALRAAIEKVNP